MFSEKSVVMKLQNDDYRDTLCHGTQTLDLRLLKDLLPGDLVSLALSLAVVVQPVSLGQAALEELIRDGELSGDDGHTLLVVLVRLLQAVGHTLLVARSVVRAEAEKRLFKMHHVPVKTH